MKKILLVLEMEYNETMDKELKNFMNQSQNKHLTQGFPNHIECKKLKLLTYGVIDG